MDKLIYMSVHLVCLVYILYKVWGWKSKVYEICILLYGKKSEKNFVNEKPFDSSVPIDETDVIGHTRFVFLDENVGETVISLYEPAFGYGVGLYRGGGRYTGRGSGM